jgi:WD40 repeat protein
MARAFAFALVLIAATVVNGQTRLVMDRKIGSDWPLNSNFWMSFAALSADGQTVAGDGGVPLGAGQVRFWGFPDGKFLREIKGLPAAISPDFRYLVLEHQILNLQSDKPIFAVADPKDTLGPAVFSADSKLVAVTVSPHPAKGSQLTILRTADGGVVSSFGRRFLCAMAFTPDGHTLVTGHWNNLTLWDVQTGERLALLMSPARKADARGYLRDGRYLGAIAVSPDGRLIAAGSDDGELQVWNLATRKLMHAASLAAEVTALAFSPDSSLIAIGSYQDGTLRLVDAATGKLLSEIQVSMFGVGTVAFSPDGKYLVTPSNEGMLNNRKYSRGGAICVFRIEK